MCVTVLDCWLYPLLYKLKCAALTLQLLKVILPISHCGGHVSEPHSLLRVRLCSDFMTFVTTFHHHCASLNVSVKTSALPPMLQMKRDKWSWASTRGQTSPTGRYIAHLDQLTWVSLPCNRQTCRKRRIQEPVQSTSGNNQNKNKPTCTYTCKLGRLPLCCCYSKRKFWWFQCLAAVKLSSNMTIRGNQVTEEVTLLQQLSLTTVGLGWFRLFACLDSIKSPEVKTTAFIYWETTRTSMCSFKDTTS